MCKNMRISNNDKLWYNLVWGMSLSLIIVRGFYCDIMMITFVIRCVLCLLLAKINLVRNRLKKEFEHNHHIIVVGSKFQRFMFLYVIPMCMMESGQKSNKSLSWIDIISSQLAYPFWTVVIPVCLVSRYSVCISFIPTN